MSCGSLGKKADPKSKVLENLLKISNQVQVEQWNRNENITNLQKKMEEQNQALIESSNQKKYTITLN